MARVERFTATGEIPVERAQLIDASAFRFSTASVQALQQAGGTLEELGRRELEAKNSLAVTAAVESRRLAKLKMQEYIKNNPDPDTWSKGAFDIINEQSATFSQQKFNSKTLKEQKLEQDAFKDQLNIEVGIAAVSQNVDNAIVTSGKNVIDAMSTDDGTPEAADEIEKLIELYKEDLERKYTKEVAAIHLEETLKESQKQQIENAKEDVMNIAAIKPEQVKANISAELKARRKGKKLSQEFALLSNTDLESIRDYANSVGDKAVSDSKIAADAAVRASYKNIISGGTNITEMAGLILADPTMTDDDKTAAVDKIKSFFTTWNSAIDEKIKTSDPTRIKALKIISDVRTADITEDEGLAQYIRLSKSEKINGTDGKQFINDIFTASKSAERDPLSTNRAKIYFGNLESLYEDAEIEALEFDKMHTALRDFFEQDPTPTPEQASSFYSELVEPVVLNWFERLMWLKGREQLFGIVGTEEERLAKKKKKAGIIGEDELTNMTDEELEAIIRGK